MMRVNQHSPSYLCWRSCCEISHEITPDLKIRVRVRITVDLKDYGLVMYVSLTPEDCYIQLQSTLDCYIQLL